MIKLDDKYYEWVSVGLEEQRIPNTEYREGYKGVVLSNSYGRKVLMKKVLTVEGAQKIANEMIATAKLAQKIVELKAKNNGYTIDFKDVIYVNPQTEKNSIQKQMFLDFAGRLNNELTEKFSIYRGSFDIIMSCLNLELSKGEDLALAVSGLFSGYNKTENEKWNDAEKVLNQVKNGNSVQYASYELRNNAEFMLSVIENKPVREKGIYEMAYASANLRNDIDFIKECISRTGKNGFLIIQYAGLDVQNNKQFISDLVDEYGDKVFDCLSDECMLKKDKEFASNIEDMKTKRQEEERAEKEKELEEIRQRQIKREQEREKEFKAKCAQLAEENNIEHIQGFIKSNYKWEILNKAPDKFIKKCLEIGFLQFSELTLEHKNSEEIVEVAIEQNIENINQASDRIREDKKFSKYIEMAQELNRYKTTDMKLKDVESDYFTNPTFYNNIVSAVKDKLQEKFMQATQGLNPNEELNEELQAKLEKQLTKIQNELERRKKFAMLKAGIKNKVDKLLHRDEASKAIKQVSKIEV